MKGKLVNPDLYDFLRENTTGARNDEKGYMIVFVNVRICDMVKFQAILNDMGLFTEHLDGWIYVDHISIDLYDLFHKIGHDGIDYRNAIDKNVQINKESDPLTEKIDKAFDDVEKNIKPQPPTPPKNLVIKDIEPSFYCLGDCEKCWHCEETSKEIEQIFNST